MTNPQPMTPEEIAALEEFTNSSVEYSSLKENSVELYWAMRAKGLIATIRALEADVSRLDGILKGDPTLISAEFGIGAPNEIKLGHPIASVIINTFYEMLKQSGGENFVTLNGYPKDPADGSRGEPIEVTIRYHNGKTPAEKLTELRAELAEVTAERDALRAKCEGMDNKERKGE